MLVDSSTIRRRPKKRLTKNFRISKALRSTKKASVSWMRTRSYEMFLANLMRKKRSFKL